MKKGAVRPCGTIFNALLEHFGDWLNTIGYQPSSQRNIYDAVGEFMAIIETQGVFTLTAIEPGHIQYHVAYLEQRPNYRNKAPGLSPRTIVDKIFAIGVFFGWLEESRLIVANPMSALRFPQPPKNVREPLTKEQINRLYVAAGEEVLSRAVLGLYYGAGLRRTEGERLNLDQVHLSARYLFVAKSKNGCSRNVPLSKGVVRDLEAYLRERKPRPGQEEAFLIDGRGRRMSGASVNKLVGELCVRAGIQPVATLHQLRHTLASELLSAGLEVTLIQEMLGHKSINSTQIYTHVQKTPLFYR